MSTQNVGQKIMSGYATRPVRIGVVGVGAIILSAVTVASVLALIHVLGHKSLPGANALADRMGNRTLTIVASTAGGASFLLLLLGTLLAHKKMDKPPSHSSTSIPEDQEQENVTAIDLMIQEIKTVARTGLLPNTSIAMGNSLTAPLPQAKLKESWTFTNTILGKGTEESILYYAKKEKDSNRATVVYVCGKSTELIDIANSKAWREAIDNDTMPTHNNAQNTYVDVLTLPTTSKIDLDDRSKTSENDVDEEDDSANPFALEEKSVYTGTLDAAALMKLTNGETIYVTDLKPLKLQNPNQSQPTASNIANLSSFTFTVGAKTTSNEGTPCWPVTVHKIEKNRDW